MTYYCIRDGDFLGHPVSAAQIAETLRGMQAVVRERVRVVTLTPCRSIPALQWLGEQDRDARAEMATSPPESVADTLPPPGEDEEITQVTNVEVPR